MSSRGVFVTASLRWTIRSSLLMIGATMPLQAAWADDDPPLNLCMIDKAYTCIAEQDGLPNSDRNGQTVAEYCHQVAVEACE